MPLVVRRSAFPRLCAALATAVLVACGPSTAGAPSAAPAAAPTTPPAQSTAPTTAPAATASPAANAANAVVPEGKPGGTLRIGVQGNPTSLDPHKNTSSFDRPILYAIYDRLVDVDANLRYVPQAADTWDVAADGKAITFHLHPGITFTDGTPLDAAAVKFNIDRVKDPATASPFAPELVNVAFVEVVDPSAVRVNLSAPTPGLFSSLAERGGLLVSPKAVQDEGGQLARQPVGSGPYTFVEWLNDDHVTLQKNPSYWRANRPYLDKLIFSIVPDANVKINGLKSGNLDIVDTVPPAQLSSITSSPDLQYARTTGLATWALVLNETRKPFDSRSVREAMNWAVDRQAIQKTLFFGTGSVAQGMLPPSSWAYDAQAVTSFTADPDKARQLLASSGVGSLPPIKILVINQPQRLQIAQAIQSNLADVGLTVTLDPVEVANYSSALRKGDYDAVLLFWAGRVDPDGSLYAWFNPQGIWDKHGYDNPQVSDLLARAAGTFDLPTRQQLYSQAEKLISADVPMVFLVHEEEGKAFSSKLQGFVPIPDGVLRFTNVWVQQ